MIPQNELCRTKTKGIEPKNDEKALIKIPLKNGEFWEREYKQSELIGKVINDFKEDNNEEFPEEYMADWKHKNNSLNLSDEIKTLLVNEVPTLVIDHNIKIKPLILGSKAIPDIIGKPFYEPFEVFAFYKNNKILKIQKYDNEEIEKNELNNYGPSSAYCNGKNKLFISGGEKKNSEIIDKFWIIDLEDQKIEETSMKQPKKNHSMIYISDNYVFFVGGNDLKTFYYEIENGQINEWVDLNKKRTEPSLMLINENLYCFDNINSKNNNYEFTLEKTNITSENPEWEIIKPNLNILENQKLNQKFFGVINDKDENIIFLGGNMGEGDNEKYNYKYNINTKSIESSNIPFEEYNFKEKTFLPYNNNVYYILPDFNRNHPEVMFYQKNKNKVSLVKYKPNNENKLRAKPRVLKYDFNFNMPKISNKIPTSENNYNKEDNNNNIVNIEDQNINININVNDNNKNLDDENKEKIKDLIKDEDNQTNKSIDKKSEGNNIFEKDININIKNPLIEEDNKDKKDIVNPSEIKIEISNPKIDVPTTEIGYTNEPPQQFEYDNKNNPDINGDQKIDIHLPSLEKNDINQKLKENLILLDSKIKAPEMNIEGPAINLNKDLTHNEIEKKETGNLDMGVKPDMKIEGPKLDLNIKPDMKIEGPKIDINSPKINSELKVSNSNLNKFNPEISINKPKIDIYSEEYIVYQGIIKGTKKKNKDKKLTSAKIDINGPKINSPEMKINGNAPDFKINSPEANINLKNNNNLDGNIDGENKIEIKPQNVNGNIDLNLKNSNNDKNKLNDFYISGIIQGINDSSNLKGSKFKSSNIKIEGKGPELDIKGPKINLPSEGGDLNFNKNIDIDGKFKNIKIDGPGINSKNSEIGINGPKFDINNPKIDIDVPEMKLENRPNIEIKGSKIEGSGNMNLPKIDGKGLDVNFNGPKIDGKINESVKTDVNGKKFFYISGIIEGIKDKKSITESKNTKIKGDIPGISVNSPNLNLNENLPNANINGSKINTNSIGGNFNLKGSNGELVGSIPGIDIKNKNNLNLPSTNIQLNAPEINHNINGKIVDFNINDKKIEGPDAELNIKDGNIPNINLPNSKINGELDGKINMTDLNKNLNSNINGPQSNSNSYFQISGIIPSIYEQNAGKKISINAPNININGDNLNFKSNKNFHGSLNQNNFDDQIGNLKGSKNLKKLNLEENLDNIKGSRKIENIGGSNIINIEMPKIEIENKDNINFGNSNKIEIGGGELGGGINISKNLPTKLNFNNDTEENKYGINVNIGGDIKNENIDSNNLGMNFNIEQNAETKALLNSSVGGSKRKGKGLPMVGSKISNFEPSKVDVAGKFDINNVDTDNLKSANVGVNGQKIGERIED